MMRVMLAGMLAAMSVCAGTAHEPAVVHVRVFEHDGDAASGVPVWISMSGQRMKAGEGDLCAVARRGLAVISNVPTDAGHVYVGLDLPVGAQRQERVAVRPGGRATTALVLPVHGSIRVVAEEGPAAGVDARRRHVELTRMEDGAVGAVQLQYVHGMITTALYERVPAGRYIVDVQINGISVARTNVAVQGRKTVEVDGTARGALSAVRGRVEDADGRGVRGRLEVRGSGERHAKIYDEFVGQYHVEPLVAGREYRLTFVVGTTSVVKKVVAGAVEEVNVRLPRSYRVTGRLQYADGSVCSNGLTLGSVAAAYSNGVAVFELVFPGVYTLRHEVLNRIMSYLIVTVEGSNVDVGEVTIADRVVIRGRIVGEKLPEQLCVEMRKKKMKTFNVAAYMALDEAGQFELRGVARDNIIRIREPGRRTQEPVAQAGPFEEDAYDLGEVRIKGRVPMRTIRAIVVVAGMGLGVLTIIPFVLYALGVRKWAVRGAAWGIWDGVAAGLFFCLSQYVWAWWQWG